MRKRTAAVLLAFAIGAVTAIPVFAATPKFNGTVGPGFTITMSKKPTKAGKTTFVRQRQVEHSQLPPEGSEREREDDRPGDRVEVLHRHAAEGQVHLPLRPSSHVDEGLLHDQVGARLASP